ncbi:MAG: domain containing protein, partial [Segetibacter sp.]|nr:domain containing protein [Segetibacter sp.]
MGRNFFLFSFISNNKQGKTCLLSYVQKCFPIVFCLIVMLVIDVPSVYSQSPVPGFKVNGQIVNKGDTIDVCIGSQIIYESTASNNSGVRWIFENGKPATSTSNSFVTVLYDTAAIDSTIQTVFNSTDTSSMYIFVRVNNQKPVPTFTYTQTDSCGNVPILFNSGGSVGNPDPLSYKWSFGDGGTDTVANPSYQFLNATGTSGTQSYPIKLLVTNSLNCSDSITKTVVVKKIPDASLGNGDTEVSGPFLYNGQQTFSRCTNIPSYTFSFINSSKTTSINNTYTINWGDGLPDSVFSNWSSGSKINHLYTIGQHTLTLTITGSTGCIGIKKYNIFLGTNPAGGFASPGNTDICAPGGLNFIISGYSNNTKGTTYSIFVNDGTQLTTYNHPPPDTVTHFFSNTSCGTTSSTYTNSFSATLIIANPCRTTSVDVKPIFVSTKPKASMSVYPSTYVCTNSTISFSNSSSGGNTVSSQGNTTLCSNNGKQVWSISPSTGYTISYGTLGDTNGNPSNSISWSNGTSFLNIIFTAPGTYTVKLLTGTDRCGADEIVKTICVRNPPQASFTMNKKSSCGTDTAIITNTSPVGGCLGDNYNWTVSYSDPSSCSTGSGGGSAFVNGTTSTGKNVNIEFSKPGRYIITLTVNANNTSYTCPPGIFRDTFYVKAKPRSKINTINAVCIGNPISPTATVSNCYGTAPLTYAWTFNNGAPSSSTQPSPGPIMYNSVGNYKVVLDVTNECGVTSDTAYATITSTPTANAGRDTSVCSGVAIKIGSASIAGYTYQWKPATGLNSSTSANPTATLNYNGPNA